MVSPLKLYKFRSMTNEVDLEGKLLPNHLRISSFGKFIRSASLDELPSLLNVIRGEYEPCRPETPLLVDYLPYYSEEEQKKRT